ncbi:hypothetical protein D3C84_94330 [compost metagenome]
MAVFHPRTIKCVCGNPITTQLAKSINVTRAPQLRERILAGEFHRTACPACSRKFTVETSFYYTDFERNTVFKVLPRGDRHTWRDASNEVDKASSYIPSKVMADADRTLRVVFGMDELREKLVAQDAGLDDRVLELLKVLLIYEHPVLVRRARLRLTLDQVTLTDFEFRANYEHSPQKFSILIPRAFTDHIEAAPDKLKAWVAAAHKTNIFELQNDHWVNIWRWSPQPGALDQLKSAAEDVRTGKRINVRSVGFKLMLARLPKGNHLPPWGKQDLRALFEYAKRENQQALQDTLFEIRFDIQLEDDWAQNDDPNDIDTLWKLLKDLPDTNVEGNTRIRELQLDNDKGGGWYSPDSNDIAIGELGLSDQESFEDTVRHEVGHAVYEQKHEVVDAWLTSEFGWREFKTTVEDVNEWVGLMGGWGILTTAEQRDVYNALTSYCIGKGSSWNPGPAPMLPTGHPWYTPGFGPRLAFEQTPSDWYEAYSTWYRANGKAFFLNYWYGTFMVVDELTLDLVAEMPQSYASMSPFEFFAELYALYFDLDDTKRSNLPTSVITWFDENIGTPEIDAPMKPRGGIRRPSKAKAKGKAISPKSSAELKPKAAAKPVANGSVVDRKPTRKKS